MTSPKRILVTTLILFVIILGQFATPQSASAACGGIVYVDKDSTAGSPTGCSWAFAFPNLQDAITLAASGDQIWVAEGTYYADLGVGQTNNNRNSTFLLKGGVAIYGGFVGTETLLSQRNSNPASNNTILSGDIDSTPGDITGNAFNVVTANLTSTNARLDGFTVTGGYTGGGSGFGAGFLIQDSSPTLSNLIITNNTAITNGGGLFILTSSNLVPEPSYSRPALTNVTISNNTANAEGGGIFTQNASPVLTNVVFSGNTAGAGAGGGFSSQTLTLTDAPNVPRLTDVTFINNTSRGGAGMFNNNSNAVLNNVTFSGNTALRRGGGMLNENSSPILTNVTFFGNISNESIGGTPWGGGGMMNVTSSPTLNNVTFSGNNSLNGSGTAGGDAIRSTNNSNPVIRNSILWGDTNDEISVDGTSTTTVFDSVVQGGYAGTNIVTTNPNLGALTNNGGFTRTMAIGIGSSALNVGNNATCAATDQRGVTRPRTVADPCDMGAYEFGGTGTITTAGNASAVYSDTAVSLTATVSPNPGGGTVQFYIDGNPVDAPASVNAGTGIATLTHNPSALNAGPHTIRADFSGVGSFLSSTSDPANNGTLTISTRSITVTADSGQSKVYGDLDPTFTYKITSGSLMGTDALTGALSRVTGEDIGTYAITQGTLTAGANYTLTFVSADFTIATRAITVTADSGQSKVYGDLDPTFTYQITSGSLAGTDALSGALNRVAGENIGTYAITQGTLSAGANYTLTFVSADFAITTRAITVTADSGQSKVYRDLDPIFTYQITSGSLFGTDTLSGALDRVAGENVGNYAITQGTLSAGPNYALTFFSANFAITARNASVTPNDAGKAYGDPDPIPLTTGTLTGFLPADGVIASYTRTAGETVGPYTISVTLSPAGVLGNYNITYNTATFTITGITVTPSITSSDKVYDGTTAATFTCSLSGVVGTDDVTCTGGTATFADKNVGTNKLVTATGLTLAGADALNYTLSPTTATDTANTSALAITVTAVTDTKTYDGTTSSAGAPSITIGALAPGDSATWMQTFDTKHVGTGKTLTPAGMVNDGNGGANYIVNFVNDTTGVINARAIEVTAATDTKPYDGTTSSTGVPTITNGSLATGDTVTWAQTFDTPTVGTGKVLTPAGTVNDGNGGNNYAVSFVTNTGTITAPPLTVTINQASGQADPTNTSTINFTVVFSASVSDFATGDVSLSGTAGATTAIVTGSGTTYNVAVSGMTVDGNVIASIPAGVASNIPGNNNLASTSSDNTVTFDITGPTVTIDQAGLQADPTNVSPINFTVVFSEPVFNFATGDVSFAGSTVGGILTGTVTGGPTNYNVAVNGMTGNGMVIATINGNVATDSAGNGNAPSSSTDNTVTFDTTAPVVTIGPPVPASTVTGPVDFNVTITGATTVNLLPANVTLNTTGTATGTISVTNGNTANPTVTISGITGNGTVGISIAAGIASDALGNSSLAAGPSTPALVDNAGPIVLFNSNTFPSDGAILSGGPTQLKVAFNEAVKNDGSAGAANNTANFLIVENGPNLALDTVSCLGAVQGDDIQITVNTATYNSGLFVSTLAINGGAPLPVGSYHLFVCGTTSIEDLTNNELNNGAADTVIDFRVVQATAVVPKTGFPMNAVTSLPAQPKGLAYISTDMWLEIPNLGVKMNIVGVPRNSTGWDVTWLDRQAGWLDGSAYPTWNGNSVLTAHVWDALNQPGPFARLKELKYGDQVRIHVFGQVYTYEVRDTTTISPTNTTAMLKHQEKAWITLITCEGFQGLTNEYSSRRMVRAVLVSVTAEK